jgi:hypothetical protein
MKKIAKIGVVALCFGLVMTSMVGCWKSSGTTIHIGVEDGIVFGTHVGGAAYKKLAESAIKEGTDEKEGFIVVTVPKDVTMVDMNLRPYFEDKNILGATFSYERKIGEHAAVKGYAYEPVAVGEDVKANTWRRHSMANAEPKTQSSMTTHALFAGVLDENAPTGTAARWSTYIGQTHFNEKIVYHFRGNDGNTYVLNVFIKQEVQTTPAKAAVKK